MHRFGKQKKGEFGDKKDDSDQRSPLSTQAVETDSMGVKEDPPPEIQHKEKTWVKMVQKK